MKIKSPLLMAALVGALVLTGFTTKDNEPVEPPTTHNATLDARFKVFFGNNAPAEVDHNLSEIYDMYGTYMATVIIQHQLNYNMFQAFVGGDTWMLRQFPNNTERHAAALAGDNKTTRKYMSQIADWLDSNYTLVYTPLLEMFDHKPMADELTTGLDEYVKRNEYGLFPGDYRTEYQNPTELFRRTMFSSPLSEVEKTSNILAHRVWLADMMLFRNLLNSMGIDLNKKNNEKIAQSFDAFMGTVEPTID